MTLSRLVVSALIPCIYLFNLNAGASKSPRSDGLTKDYAAYRASILRNVKYELLFDLIKSKKSFELEAYINFHSSKAAPLLSLDYSGQQIISAELNGKTFRARARNGVINLPAAMIRKGLNRVYFKTKSHYSSDGKGLTKYLDPQDLESYLATSFKPYYANRLFPSFDQPDLKATFQTQVKAPKHWQVITPSLVASTNQRSKYKTWTFARTPPIATYTFNLAAGPFKVLEIEEKNIKSKIYLRKSLNASVDHHELFRNSMKLTHFFARYFDLAYPFSKLDYVFLPNISAKTNDSVATIFLSEDFIIKGRSSSVKSLQHDQVIAQKISQQWFGNYLTPKWWGDLWLSESTTNFLSFVALKETLQRQDTVIFELLSTKFQGHIEDQFSVSHPLAMDIKNISEALASFDDITSRKGAAVLKQLQFVLGGTILKRVLADLTKTHPYGNITYHNFIESINRTTNASFTQWQQDWIKSTGSNAIKAEFSCNQEAKINRLRILQKPDNHNQLLRTHRTRFGLFTKNKSGSYELESNLDINYRGFETFVSNANDRPCPSFIIPNIDGFDYARIRLSRSDFKILQNEFASFKLPQARALLIHSAFDMAFNSEITMQELISTLIKDLETENNEMLIEFMRVILFDKILPYSKNIFSWIPQSNSNEIMVYNQTLTDLQSVLKRRLQSAEPSSATQSQFFEMWLTSINSSEHSAKLKSILQGQTPIRGLKLSNSARWDIIHALARINDKNILKLISSEKKRSDTVDHHKKYLQALAEIGSDQYKIKLLDEYIIHPKNQVRENDKITVLEKIFRGITANKSNIMSNRFYEMINKEISNSSPRLASILISTMTPVNCNKSQLGRVIKLKTNLLTKMSPLVSKAIDRTIELDRRCQHSQSFARSQAKSNKKVN
jgi:aminopeptidase N